MNPRLNLGLLLVVSATVGGALGCGSGSGWSGPPVRFDPCATLSLVPDQSATPAQTAAITGGLALWNAAAGTGLALETAGAPTLPIHFQSAAAPFHGLYDPSIGQIFVNDDLSGTAEAITIAHEIGHAFGLVHVSPTERPSVMNPDNLDVTPTPDDVATLAGFWNRCLQLDAAGPE